MIHRVSPSMTDQASSSEELQLRWQQLNQRYWAGILPPIAIRWSQRLTSSIGIFTSQGGPRTRLTGRMQQNRREIRLSLPLFERLSERTSYVEQELFNTLAHEMIHQWQFDILKRRPDHGLDFLRKMTEINRAGEVAITIYHSLEKEVVALSRFASRCVSCGHVYRRQRRTIEPRWHHCGSCQGALQELPVASTTVSSPQPSHPNPVPTTTAIPRTHEGVTRPAQLSFLF